MITNELNQTSLPTAPIVEKQPNQSDNKKFSAKKFMASREGWVVGAGILLFGTMGYLYGIMTVVSFYLGGYAADQLIKKGNVNKKLITFVAWLNVISWLFSFQFFNFGLFTSKITQNTASLDPSTEKRNKRLATISYVLSITISILIWFLSTSIINMEKYGTLK